MLIDCPNPSPGAVRGLIDNPSKPPRVKALTDWDLMSKEQRRAWFDAWIKN